MVSNLVLKRAHHPEQKQERRGAILAAARAGLAEGRYDELSMARLAAEAGVAKGTLYLYFPTRESVFLALLEAGYQEAFDALRSGLDALPRPAGADAVAGVFCAVLTERPLLRELAGRMHTVLEHNIDHATARRFKHVLRHIALELGARIERLRPGLPAGAGAALVFEAHVLCVGWQHAANPAPVIREVQADPELQLFQADFADRFQQSFAAILRGWPAP